MPTILLRAVIVLATSAIALWAASLLLDDVHLTVVGVITASVIFTVLFLLLTPVVGSLLKQYAEGVVALTGLIVAYLSLLITDLISDNLNIEGVLTWVLATLIVWVAMIVVRWLFGAVFRKRLAET
jgi:hypothetical protein